MQRDQQISQSAYPLLDKVADPQVLRSLDRRDLPQLAPVHSNGFNHD